MKVFCCAKSTLRGQGGVYTCVRVYKRLNKRKVFGAGKRLIHAVSRVVSREVGKCA
jgi:hypothetical protein